MRIFLIVGIATVLAISGPMLDLMGWDYSSSRGSALFKIHPSTLAFLAAAILAMSTRIANWRILREPTVLFFVIMAFAVTVVGGLQAGGGGGEFSAAFVTFLTAALALVALRATPGDYLARLAIPVRLFFVFNSLMAIVERVIGHRFVPSFMDDYSGEFRAAALVGHPLSGALLTALLLVNLATARARGQTFARRIPEMALHGLALLAFGGRLMLVLAPIVIAVAAVAFTTRRARGQANVSAIQRLFPVAMAGGVLLLVTLPIPFIQQTLTRFTSVKGQDSSDSRNAAVDILQAMTQQEFLYGMPAWRRIQFVDFYDAGAAIEISWIALIAAQGALVAIPLLVAMVLMLLTQTRQLDRSAFFMVLLFVVGSAGSLSIGGKTLALVQLLVLMFTLSQPRLSHAALTARAATGDAEPAGAPAPRPTRFGPPRPPARAGAPTG